MNEEIKVGDVVILKSDIKQPVPMVVGEITEKRKGYILATCYYRDNGKIDAIQDFFPIDTLIKYKD